MEVEKYIILSTTSELALANKTCAALEKANIPVLIEHADAFIEEGKRLSYRILVPLRYSQAARRISDNALFSFEDRPSSKPLFAPFVASNTSH
ncbi:MAG: hypothetical protein GYA55_03420 [SAR324 cluster bacterium]|uniref:DUF2007 domain-containing protein n=1 Tax=SAR324 cluster bacterium TaxID=2024889 RepID=A0A7X9FQ17_9DELT|nr:hypothetical protein [SAR324 cluster bacterium]